MAKEVKEIDGPMGQLDVSTWSIGPAKYPLQPEAANDSLQPMISHQKNASRIPAAKELMPAEVQMFEINYYMIII